MVFLNTYLVHMQLDVPFLGSFISPQQIHPYQRFSSDFLLESDATFGNNQLRMPLAQTFSAGFWTESCEDFNFTLFISKWPIWFGGSIAHFHRLSLQTKAKG